MDENKININWYPGHMAKTKKQIIEDLKLVDIIIEILDARAPKASENPDVKEYCKNKKKIIVLNKADLADENETNKWVKFYEEKGIPCVKVDSNNKKGLKEVIKKIKEQYEEINKIYIQKGRIGRNAKVMVVGIPNVGKSTFINSLAKRNAAQVGNKPGVTKQKQWIKIDEKIELLDTPGMLWPKIDEEKTAMHLAFINTIGQNAIDNEEVSYELLKYLVENYREKVEERYSLKIENGEEIIDIINKIALKKGAILSGGRINNQKVSDMILTDFRTGKLGTITIERVENKE